MIDMDEATPRQQQPLMCALRTRKSSTSSRDVCSVTVPSPAHVISHLSPQQSPDHNCPRARVPSGHLQQQCQKAMSRG